MKVKFNNKKKNNWEGLKLVECTQHNHENLSFTPCHPCKEPGEARWTPGTYWLISLATLWALGSVRVYISSIRWRVIKILKTNLHLPHGYVDICIPVLHIDIQKYIYTHTPNTCANKNDKNNKQKITKNISQYYKLLITEDTSSFKIIKIPCFLGIVQFSLPLSSAN